MSLFEFTSALDGRKYEAVWSHHAGHLGVNLANGQINGNPDAARDDQISLVRSFEMGRLSPPKSSCPYPTRVNNSEQINAWQFGSNFRPLAI